VGEPVEGSTQRHRHQLRRAHQPGGGQLEMKTARTQPTVTETLPVVALYEAAVANALPKQVLNNGLPGEGAAILGLAPAAPGVVGASPATTAIVSGGSVTGKVVVAATGPLFMQPSTVQAAASPQVSQPNLVSVDVVPDHVYEIVDIQNGWIGLRNPWGTNSGNDKQAQTASGVFYVNQATFNQMFGVVTVSEPPK